MSGRVDDIYNQTVVIAAGTAVSGAADISTVGMRGAGLRGNWEDMDSAQLGIQVSYDEGTPTNWNDMWKINAAADGYDAVACPDPSSLADGDPIEVPPQAWMAGNARWLRVVSRNTSTYATPVNQTSAITITIGTLA